MNHAVPADWDTLLDTLEERQRIAARLIHGGAEASAELEPAPEPANLPAMTSTQRLRVFALLDATQRTLALAEQRRRALDAGRAYSR